MRASVYKARSTALIQFALACLLYLGCLNAAHAEVVISGVEPQIRDNILAYLRLDDETCDAPDWRVRRLFAVAETEIREALEVVGFYSVEIEKTLKTGDSCWQANFSITLGRPVVLRTVSITIDTGDAQDSELESVVQQCALRSGDVLQGLGGPGDALVDGVLDVLTPDDASYPLERR